MGRWRGTWDYGRDRCSTGDGTQVRTERWTDDDGTRVVLQTLVGGGHTWPSSRTAPPPEFGALLHDLDASAEAVAFVTDAHG